MNDTRPTNRRERLILVLAAIGLLALVASVQVGLHNALQIVLGPSEGAIHPIGEPAAPLGNDYADLHLELLRLDEVSRLLTVQVSGRRVCQAPCPAGEDVVLLALRPNEPTARGLPVSVRIPLPANGGPLLLTVQLPVRGRLIRYPFDTYELVLGVALWRQEAGGAIQPLSSDQAAGRLRLTLQSALPQVDPERLGALEPAAYRSAGSSEDLLYVEQLTFGRPLSLKAMTVSLVILIGVTGVYAVFLRSLSDLVLGLGSLLLGVWGVRSVLVPGTLTHRTGVDVALSVVIAVVVVSLGLRGIWYLVQRGGQPPPPEEQLATSSATATAPGEVAADRSPAGSRDEPRPG